jgi:hypothetical protein
MMSISREDILKKHLPYEIDMLRQTYRQLADGQLSHHHTKMAFAVANLLVGMVN